MGATLVRFDELVDQSQGLKQRFKVLDVVTTIITKSIPKQDDIGEGFTYLKMIQEKEIEVKVEKLGAEISELAKERGMVIDDKDSNFMDYLDEEFIEINVLETRAVASACGAPPLVEGNAVDDLRRAVFLRDDQIS